MKKRRDLKRKDRQIEKKYPNIHSKGMWIEASPEYVKIQNSKATL